jgi:hypothetical protein
VTVSSSTTATVSFIRDLTTGGSRTLVFTNSDGGTVSTALAPTACATMGAISVSPSSGTIPHTGQVMTITGTNFVQGATVTVSAGTVANVTWVNATTMTFKWTTVAKASSPYTISVNLDGQTKSKNVTLTVS